MVGKNFLFYANLRPAQYFTLQIKYSFGPQKEEYNLGPTVPLYSKRAITAGSRLQKATMRGAKYTPNPRTTKLYPLYELRFLDMNPWKYSRSNTCNVTVIIRLCNRYIT